MRTSDLLWIVGLSSLLACNNGGDDAPIDTDTDGDTDVEDTEPPVEDVTLRFRVRGVSVEGFTSLDGARCEWTRRTGESWPVPVTSTTDADGFCLLDVPEDRSTVTVRVTLDDHVDVLAAGFPVRVFDEDNAENTTTGIVMFTEDQADQTYEAFDLTRDTAKGYVTGAATWLPSGQGALQPIGCVTIDASEADPAIDVYLGGTPQNPRDSTSPLLGTWLGFDIDPGSYAFEATVEGGPSRRVTVPVLANTFTNIPLFFQASTNPTPADCE